MFAIKLKTAKDTWIVRLSGVQLRRSTRPWRLGLKPTKWKNRRKAESFLATIKHDWREQWRLNNEKPFDLEAIYSIVEIPDTAQRLGC